MELDISTRHNKICASSCG